MDGYYASIKLPRAEATVPVARRLVTEILMTWQWSTSEQRHDAILLVNEIVTNAVEHTRGKTALLLELAQSGRWLRVSVADSSPAHPVVLEVDHRRARGRGMWLVATIARNWGVDNAAHGKSVWFEMDAHGSFWHC